MEIYIDKHQPSKAYIKESVSVTTSYKKILKNKRAKISNIYAPFKIVFIIVVVVFVLALLLAIFSEDKSAWAFPAEVGICLALMIFFWILIKISYRKMGKNYGGVTIVINEEGIIHRDGNDQEIKTSWDNIYMVRIFSELTVIYPKKEGGIMIMIENKYTPELIRGLAEYGKSDLIVQ